MIRKTTQYYRAIAITPEEWLRTPLPKCPDCGNELTMVLEEYKGDQTWNWQEEKQHYDTDSLPQDIPDFKCPFCGEMLPETLQEFFQENKA